LETAIALGATGSEIDIQRTKDGRYIVNHDETFERVAGDPRAPKNMTLAEIRELRYPVPTLEEMLEASRGRIWLFIELKGSTADKRMCNDAVRLIRARNMSEQTVIMSFNHNLIAYVEGRWPEMRTACLTLEQEDAASLACDYIGVEAHAVTAPYIRAVHEQGKKLLVWTPNGAEAQEYFLISDADAVITDNVEQAFQIRDCLNRKNDLGRILSAFRP
jgi:glycerophosphoryl diester phosphodiesterase